MKKRNTNMADLIVEVLTIMTLSVLLCYPDWSWQRLLIGAVLMAYCVCLWLKYITYR